MLRFSSTLFCGSLVIQVRQAVDIGDQIEQAARVCHETIRAYTQTLGDNSLPSWEEATEYQKESSRQGVRTYFEQYAAGLEPTPKSTHESWLKERKAGGWKHGRTKNQQTKEHPSFVPFDDLPAEEKRKDYLFAAVCKAFCVSTASQVQTVSSDE
jgi:hypothetical protein